MHYADHHFSEDPEFFSAVSKLSSELMSQSKRYPHPMVMYKTLLWMSKLGNDGEKLESKVDKVDELDRRGKVNKERNNIKKENEEKIDMKIHKANEEVNKVKEVKIESSKSSEQSLQSSEILSSLPLSLQNAFIGQYEITSIENTIAKIIVVGPLGKMAMNKKENHDLLCQALNTQSAPISQIEFTFMNKEEYFAYKM